MLGPVAVLIGLGFLLRAARLLQPAGWAAVERLVYFACFPPLLFLELARADLAGQPVLAFGGTLLATQLLAAAALTVARPWLRLPGPAYTSVMQCVVRWNSYVAVAVAPGLFGPAAAPLAAIAVAIMVPTANLISVATLARHGRAVVPGPLAMLRGIVANPLILACAAGIAVNASRIELPVLVGEPLLILSRATLALGLLTVGAGLAPAAALHRPLVVLGATFAKVVVKPLVAIGLGRLAGLDPLALGVVALACGVPTATSSYILARLLGGDAELMAGLITATTLAALLTLPVMIALAG